jgi:hypothetical protein
LRVAERGAVLPADRPTVEEISLMMRQAGPGSGLMLKAVFADMGSISAATKEVR